MSRVYSGSGSAAQLERLARLSDDNAFVDVEATLKRIGGEGAWEASVSGGGGGSFDGTASPMIGMPSSSGGTSTPGAATAAGARRGHARKGTRASEAALLSGVRIPLTASLQDQHKAYLESVCAAAKEWEEASCNSSGSDTSASDSAGEDGNGIGGSGGVQTAERRRVTLKTRRRGPQAKAISAEALPPTSLLSPGSPSELTVTSVRRSPAASAAVARKRSHEAQRAGRDTADTEADRRGDQRVSLAKSDPCSSLVATLTAELRLIRQWERLMHECPPQMINGVLSPEPRAPWVQTTSTSRKADASPSSSEATYFGDDDTEVLPYPLLQVYSICPSYEALTAGPVHRREVVRCTATARGRGFDESPRRGLVSSSPMPAEAAPTTVQVADFKFAVSEQLLGNRKRRGQRHRKGADYTDGSGSGGQVDFIDPGSEDAVQGERQHHLCSVCMLPASYRCLRCRTALFCSIDCHVLHDATRCLKFTV